MDGAGRKISSYARADDASRCAGGLDRRTVVAEPDLRDLGVVLTRAATDEVRHVH